MKLLDWLWVMLVFLSASLAYVPVSRHCTTKYNYGCETSCRHDIFGERTTASRRTVLCRRSCEVTMWSKQKRHDDEEDAVILKERIAKVWKDVLEQEMQSPPNNPELSPVDFVSKILECLLQPDDPMPDSGYRILLRSSSHKWKREIKKSLGVPTNRSSKVIVSEEVLASALGTALMRPNNQFGILVNNDNNDDDGYKLQITHTLDYQDGTCWVGSRLVSSSLEKKVLVMIGWQLIKRSTDGAWMIDSIQWQDFRDAYRPGIGREEWYHLID